MKAWKHSFLLSSVLVASASLFVACGGGGGGSDSTGGGGTPTPTGPLTDACSLLKPKILTGTACDSRTPTPIANVSIVTPREEATCSGTLIAPRFVLTAGHCILGAEESGVSSSVNFGGASIAVIRSTRHPQYRESENADVILNDVGILELASDADVDPLPVSFSAPPAVGDIISIFGYGNDDSGNFGALRSGQMRITEVSENVFFALYGAEGSNTCEGDSGGPATKEINGDTVLVGVTSSGTTVGCVRGDNSSFALLSAPEISGFVRSLVPGVDAR